MKNIFKIIFILCLGIFVAAGCADDSSGGNGGGNTENTGDSDNNGGDNDTPEFTKLISAEGLSYGETADGKRYVWGKEAGSLIGKWGIIATPVEVDFTINKIIVDGFTVYVLTDAGLYAWGNNKYGQVGNGTTDYVLTAYKVEGIPGNIKEIITGDTVYVLTDTGLYAWGNNEYGQVGNGTTENVTTPYKAVGGNIKEFKNSNRTYYALTDDGLYVWGNNSYGQVGNGTTENVTKPYPTVAGNIKEVIIDVYTVYVLTDTGLYAWGYNSYGQVGNGTTEKVLKPYPTVEGNIKEFRDSGSTYYALTDDGLYAWGNNEYGQVGNGTTENVPTPHKVEGIDGTIKEIITGNTVYALTENGALYAWGGNGYGQVGNGDWGYEKKEDGSVNPQKPKKVLTPFKVEGITGNIKEVINHHDNTVYVLTENGALYAWGNNEYGEVGNGTTENVTKPHKVEGITGNIKEFIISGSWNTTYYVLTEDGLYAWGNNLYGEVGNGESGYEKDEYGDDNRSKPKTVLKPYKAVGGNIKEFRVSGGYTYYALTDKGLYAWGNNSNGQVGNGTTEKVLKPYKAVEGNIKEFRVSGSSSVATYYALTDTGLYVWGNNEYGQVGNGTTEKVLKPYPTVGGNIKEFKNSNRTYYALTDDGLYAWGNNGSGQVGNGTTENVPTPHKVEGIDGTIKEIITGNTVYALTENGALYAWGNNEYGEVGNGESGYEKDEDGNNDYSKPKKVLTPYEVQVKQN